MNSRGVLIVISGFSGAGKGTVVKELVKKYDYGLSVSATSRKAREGEEHGREYFFLTREEFQGMIESGQLIEWTEYVGNYYGTPRSYVESQLAEGRNVILEIEIEGAFHVKELFHDALLLFIAPPTAKELENRLISRGTESEEVVRKRLARAYEEADYMKDYDYIIINDCLEECVESIHQLIGYEQLRAGRQDEFMREIKTGLKVFQEGE